MGDMLSFQIINVLNPPCNKNLLNLVNILAQNYNNKKKKDSLHCTQENIAFLHFTA